jgi:tellurite resistance-related uncharacterized protein
MAGRPPEDVAPYKRTPIFDQHTMPAGLRHEHRTKAGVWAVIQVIEGRLRYRIIDPPSEQILSPEQPGVVRPEQRHDVTPLGNVRFFVEFYAREQPAGDSHDKG